jgi:hypothetical protein
MSLGSVAPAAEYHRGFQTLLIVLAAAMLTGRVATVRSSGGATPMLSANDRSRWTTIRALVDNGTYAIDDVIFRATGERNPAWYTIDLVQHRGPDGRQHYYSSKPTLLSTLFAAPYWAIHHSTGIEITRHPYYVMRFTLLFVNVIPMVMFLMLLARMLEELCETEWSRQFALAAAAFATPLTPFAITLNNHTPAAVCVLLTAWAVVSIWRSERPHGGWFVLAGTTASLAVACELPALSLLALVAAVLFWKSPRQSLLAFLPPVLLVVAAAVGTNYVAHGTWSTPYAHRRDGAVIAQVEPLDRQSLRAGPLDSALRDSLAAVGLTLSADSEVKVRPLDRGYLLWDPETQRKYAARTEGEILQVRDWDNWYEFDGSYWSSDKIAGVDRGERSRWMYAFHALCGHHGVFSLTPIWLIAAVGVMQWLAKGTGTTRGLALATGTLTAVCLAFYILLRPMEDRNYGGVSCCFRWTIWLIPLWLLCLSPALDAMARRPWLRWLALGLLLLSAFSVSYSSRNPWTHPWLFDYWARLGWLRY